MSVIICRNETSRNCAHGAGITKVEDVASSRLSAIEPLIFCTIIVGGSATCTSASDSLSFPSVARFFTSQVRTDSPNGEGNGYAGQ